MSDFGTTMRDWRRMCDWYERIYKEDCCNECPLRDFTCDAIYEVPTDSNWEQIESIIDAWINEHPVHYPTWREYLDKLGMWNAATGTKRDDWINSNRIPEDIAKKLGIQPKE